ncbi:unnamed protein product, partial [Effrenium voratum]
KQLLVPEPLVAPRSSSRSVEVNSAGEATTAVPTRCSAWNWVLVLVAVLALCATALAFDPRAAGLRSQAKSKLDVVLGRSGFSLVERNSSKQFLEVKAANPNQPKELFCWALIQAGSGEEALMIMHRKQSVNIFGCDAWLLLSDFPVSFQDVKSVPVGAFNSKRSPWNSWYNVPVFLRAWAQVVQDPRFQQFDWTVKLDMDTFVCHKRLRAHLRASQVNPSEPHFWLNYDAAKNPGPLDFLGPIEIFSRGAVQRFKERHLQVCPRPHPQSQGEDGFMKDCMLRLGAIPRKDYQLLLNACDWCQPLQPGQCSNGWFVAFHPFKDVEHYQQCMGAAGSC